MSPIGETPSIGSDISGEERGPVSPEIMKELEKNVLFPVAVARFKKEGHSDEQAKRMACWYLLALYRKYQALRAQGESHECAEHKASVYADGVASNADPSMIDAAMGIAPKPPWLKGRDS